MRRLLPVLVMVAVPLVAQGPPPRRMGPSMGAETAEGAIKRAAEQLGVFRKICERDVEVLRHLRTADAALADPMQPATVIQKAYEEVSEAKRLNPDFVVAQGILRVLNDLESARRSPIVADFGHLRSVLRQEALAPASRVAVRNALRLEEESQGWLKVQQLIADHLRTISDISGQSLRAAEQEK